MRTKFATFDDHTLKNESQVIGPQLYVIFLFTSFRRKVFQSRDTATLTSEASYALCMETLEQSIKFILSHPLIERFDMETKLQVIEVRELGRRSKCAKLKNKYFSNGKGVKDTSSK